MDTSSEMTSREKSIFMLGALYGMAYDAKNEGLFKDCTVHDIVCIFIKEFQLKG